MGHGASPAVLGLGSHAAGAQAAPRGGGEALGLCRGTEADGAFKKINSTEPRLPRAY